MNRLKSTRSLVNAIWVCSALYCVETACATGAVPPIDAGRRDRGQLDIGSDRGDDSGQGHCGDGHTDIDRGEECDDRNTVSGDGCSSTCQIEVSASCSDISECGTGFCFGVCFGNDPIYVKASNAEQGDFFGKTVAVSGTAVAVGAPNEDSCSKGVNQIGNNNDCGQSGAVYIFRKTGATWSEEAYIKASNSNDGAHFGSSVAMENDLLVVGAEGEKSCADGVNGDENDVMCNRAGAVYVFRRDAAGWKQEAYLKAAFSDEQDEFGRTVALSKGRILVGAANEDGCATTINGNENDNGCLGAGAAYLFEFDGSSWSQTAYIKSPNLNKGDTFGTAVAIDQDRLVISSLNEDSCATNVGGSQSDEMCLDAGAAYVFEMSGTLQFEAYLKAQNTENYDRFGSSVAIKGNHIAVGANGEDSCATMINGNAADNMCSTAGAVYTFEYTGSWVHRTYLKAADSRQGDGFSNTTFNDDGTFISVGAVWEDSCSTGINQDPTNTMCDSAGALYVFGSVNKAPVQQAYVKPPVINGIDNFAHSVSADRGVMATGIHLDDSCSKGFGGDPNDNLCSQAGAIYIWQAQ